LLAKAKPPPVSVSDTGGNCVFIFGERSATRYSACVPKQPVSNKPRKIKELFIYIRHVCRRLICAFFFKRKSAVFIRVEYKREFFTKGSLFSIVLEKQTILSLLG